LAKSYLHQLAANTDLDEVPTLWKSVDLQQFSEGKTLYAYQREALENALKVLYQFYQAGANKDSDKLKNTFSNLLFHHGFSPDIEKKIFSSQRRDSKAFDILTEHYPTDNQGIAGYHFINRMSFWMATGSGKSVVLIKMMEMLHSLMSYDLIPKNDILFLSHRPDLIEQLKAHIEEFNTYLLRERGIEFMVRELKEFPEQKRQGSLFAHNHINIYYYRSDLIGDIEKENVTDYRNYLNDGNWYVVLDEAHKGDSEESKRKQYYNILSKNGFLFNFSATFTDEMDRLSTVYNLNLAEYIQQGFGKHLYVFQEQFKHFKTQEIQDGKKVIIDYVEEEKQKIVLMSLILLAFIKKEAEANFNTIEAYHNPMLLTLVNSVSAEDSDLYLFFNELRKIAKNEVNQTLFEAAKTALAKDLREKPNANFELEKLFEETDIERIKNIEIKDIWQKVFNVNSSGELEVRRNPKNAQELSFRVKSGANSLPFALIKIGKTDAFIKNNLDGYSIEEDFDNVNHFDNLNQSSVNILMGSRAFYEGWDSNRPNIINFVNIGTDKDASKFILQSIGRGIRIEPLKNHRKRLKGLVKDKVAVENVLQSIENQVNSIETLFVFGTNQKAILAVLESLKEAIPEQEHQLDLFEEFSTELALYIPVYKEVTGKKERDAKRLKLKIHEDDLEVFNNVMQDSDRKAVLMNFNLSYNDLALLEEKQQNANHFKPIDDLKIGKLKPLVQHILNYYHLIPEELDGFKVISDEIKHHKSITVRSSPVGSATAIDFKRLEELKSKIQKVKNAENEAADEETLDKLFDEGKISREEYKERLKNLGKSTAKVERFTHHDQEIEIKTLLNHYYFPSLLSLSEFQRIQWIKHIVDTKSEVDFLHSLEAYLTQTEHFFQTFDSWSFCKIDHTIDKQVRIPYIDPATGKRDFLPDFVFWLQKGNDYHILYLDPKGTEHQHYQFKIDGYKALFEENGEVKTFEFKGKNFKVHLRLVTDDLNKIPDANSYKKYWIEKGDFAML
jgi:type III restriction enzyme